LKKALSGRTRCMSEKSFVRAASLSDGVIPITSGNAEINRKLVR